MEPPEFFIVGIKSAGNHYQVIKIIGMIGKSHPHVIKELLVKLAGVEAGGGDFSFPADER